jgi:ADP-ribose pyrophosphatase YjhB (NUDIX family)
MLYKLGAFVTVRDELGRVLLCHRRDADFWGQPGGGVEAGETPWKAVVREVREETGLEVVVERLAGLYCWPTEGELIFSFVCIPTGGQLATSDETSAVAYFPAEALPPNTFAEHRERIRDALDAAGVALRVPACLSAVEEMRRGKESAR